MERKNGKPAKSGMAEGARPVELTQAQLEAVAGGGGDGVDVLRGGAGNDVLIGGRY